MNLLLIAVAILLFFGLIVFILLFGESPRLRNGIIGKANRALTVYIPRWIIGTLKKVLGPKNWNRLSHLWHYCFESRNPFLQIFFMILTSGSIYLFLKYGLPHIPGIYLHSTHLIIIPSQIVSLYLSYYMACTVDPGTITAENVQQYLDHFKYDGLLYQPKQCSTCRLQKPARSKHCSMCKACIGRLDHHCFWINRCVGVNNHRFFFIFLFTLVQFCAYGAYLCFQIYRGMIIEWGLDAAYVIDKKTGQHSPITFRKAFLHVLQKDRIIGAIGILATVVSLVVFLFFLYQLYLAGRGITTNEAFKWELIEDSIDRGELWLEEENTATNDKDKVKKRMDGSKKRQRKVESLEELDNIYDEGFYRNLYNVFFPPRMKKAA
ncbi:hypothetical protein O0I10_002255 [Lichtheimia ornata]|uniref:Palmitoyltransferase n=1 Tax=Lichtheimia ornata TaxID=688661 RepID=A0AAD7XYK0_9FUNG|nr:uncharacterized protein O0I10_002255 [Lichtheimia ornata]KAJ8661924.1 hypothetical protein O0I10_002255 [Lichtheimia ornata]